LSIESGGYILNDKDKWCIQGYQDLGDLGGAARKAALIESEGYMVNTKGVVCSTGYHKLGNLRKAALVESEGYMVNDKGVVCSTGYHKLGKLGGAGKANISAVNALGEHHTHICISVLCQRGASVKLENGYAILVHHRHVHSNQDWQDSRRDRRRG